MTEINLWLIKGPFIPPVKITLNENVPVSELKNKLLAQLDPLAAYKIICLRTGDFLGDDTIPISANFRNDDSLMVQQIPDTLAPVIEPEAGLDKPDSGNLTMSPVRNNASLFSLTGIASSPFDFLTEYPVLAINIRYTPVGRAPIRPGYKRSKANTFFSEEKPFYTKETFFLIADEDIFRWISPAESNLFIPGMENSYPEHVNGQISRYSLKKNEKEPNNMIYPVRAFSITGITMDGFNSEKAYPVLAIDVDQYIEQNNEPEEDQSQEQPRSQSMAFFLVGDDNGEFAWIAEDECRLYPLKG
jgi:hypothetical protein